MPLIWVFPRKWELLIWLMANWTPACSPVPTPVISELPVRSSGTPMSIVAGRPPDPPVAAAPVPDELLLALLQAATASRATTPPAAKALLIDLPDLWTERDISLP